MNNENKKEYESNNDNTEPRFYDKPNYNEKITLSRLIPIESKGHRLIIGKGAFSNVYLYKDIISQEKYAVKIMEKDFILKNLETLEIINKEIEIQSRINHPNIIRLYNIYENSNTIYMIMEYLNNGNLFDFIHKEKEKLDMNLSINISLEIALAIKYLHCRNITHCDLKSKNVLLDQNYHIKITDFRFSKMVNILFEKSNKLKGKKINFYMPPEIMKNLKYEEKSDVFSYGMIIYEIITGEIPYSNYLPNQIIGIVGDCRKIIQVNDHNNNNPYLRKLIIQCLKYNIQERPSFKSIIRYLTKVKSILKKKDFKFDDVDQFVI